MFAVGELAIRRGFVTDFEPLEMNNADVFVAAFPDLALLKFHRRKIHLSCCLAASMQLGRMRLRCRFLRKVRSEPRAYPPWNCMRQTTKPLRKKIKQTHLIRLHGYGLIQER